MAKTIKFNLICDKNPVRTLEDLQNNFSIEDVLAYYDNRLLHRWLRVRGYEAELQAVSSITCDDPMDIIKELIRIFDVVADGEKVEESIYMLRYLEERKELCAIYEAENYKTKQIIEDYEAGYSQLVSKILENPNDAAIIKATITEIVSNYEWVLALDHRDLFWRLTKESRLAIMCLLMNEKTRGYYLPIKTTEEDGTITVDTDSDFDKKAMFNRICAIIKEYDFEKTLAENLVIFSGVTDGYWRDLAPKGKRFMIISMGNGDYVRSAGQLGKDLSHDDIREQFVIVDGIDYKSNSSSRQLWYMEV